MGGGKGSSPKAPAPIDPGKSMGEYLFGKGFSSQYQGVTDPALQDRLIAAERTYRPQYTALELADIGVMARGIEAGTPNPAYQRIEAQLAGARAAQESGMTTKQLEAQANRMFPVNNQRTGTKGRVRPKAVYSDINAGSRAEFLKYSSGKVNAGDIATLEAQLKNTPKTQGGTPGLFDLLEEQSTRAGALQREQLGLQRADDVGALQEFAPQVVEAYRDADPYSTGLAEQQTAMAEDLYQRSQGLNSEQQRLVDQQALGMAQRQGRVTDQSAVAGQLLGRENYLSGLRGQAAGMGQQAFNQNRLLAGDVGMTILGRPSNAIGLGGQMLNAAQQGAQGQMGPQLFDPNVGINMAMQQQANEVNYAGNMAQARASGSSGLMSAAGSIAGGMIAACWVAREVYGIENPKWLEFREWMLNDAPIWLRSLYLKYGERTAKFISNKPRVKSIIRKWMNTKIK